VSEILTTSDESSRIAIKSMVLKSVMGLHICLRVGKVGNAYVSSGRGAKLAVVFWH